MTKMTTPSRKPAVPTRNRLKPRAFPALICGAGLRGQCQPAPNTPMAKLFFRYAAMNAGKSTALLQVAHNYEERGHRVRIFTARLDDRYGSGFVTSRLGPQREVEQFDAGTDFIVLADEAPFIKPQKNSNLLNDV